MRLKPCPTYSGHAAVGCRLGILRRRNPCFSRCTASEQHPRPDVLLLDATNILSRAAIDAKRCSNIPEVSIRYCFGVWVKFLIAATTPHLLVVAVFDNPATGGNRKEKDREEYLRRRRRQRQKDLPLTSSNAGKLKPFIETIESLEGGIALISEGGYEADECIGAVCALLKDTKIGNSSSKSKISSGPLSICIASGDSDMQQYLSSTTSWLHIAPLPTLDAPDVLSTITETSFFEEKNFPPAAYTDYLALVGKKEASIGGVGIGTSVAEKLLKQFHSVAGIEQAVQQGILKGWPPAVEATFSEKRGQLERNLEIFWSVTDPEVVLTPAQQGKLLARIAPPTSTTAKTAPAAIAVAPSRSTELVWQHPFYALRWLQAGPLANNLLQIVESKGLGPCQVQAVTSQGLPIDLIFSCIQSGGGGGSGGGSNGFAVMVCAQCDFSDKTQPKSTESTEDILDLLSMIEQAKRDGAKQGLEGLYDPCRVGKKLNRAAQHHISLLKKSGAAPILIPWWIVEELMSISERNKYLM